MGMRKGFSFRRVIAFAIIFSILINSLYFNLFSVYADDSAKNIDGFLQPIEEPITSAIKISNADELYAVRQNMMGTYILTDDIDMEDYPNWMPIGTKSEPFRGIFDGQGHTIKGLDINRSADMGTLYGNYMVSGLFGVCENATIKNLEIEDASISITVNNTLLIPSATLDSSYSSYAGIIAAKITDSSIIYNCHVSGNIDMVQQGEAPKPLYGGGIIGWVDNSVIADCYVYDGTIKTSSEASLMQEGGGAYSGGIASKITGQCTVNRCSNNATLSAVTHLNDDAIAGGIIGTSDNADDSIIYDIYNIFLKSRKF